MKRNWIVALVAVALIIGCVMWEMMALVVSIVAIVVYALIIDLFVGPIFESTKQNEDDK